MNKPATGRQGTSLYKYTHESIIGRDALSGYGVKVEHLSTLIITMRKIPMKSPNNNGEKPVDRRRFLKYAGAGAAVLMLPFELRMALASGTSPGKDSVLVVIDVQNCFLPGGSLPVSEGDQIIPIINMLGKKFENVIFTQDWHTPGHASFASSHEGKSPFDTIELPYGKQMLWPDHCVQGTKDAQLADGLDISHAQLIIRKGYHDEVDSYSTFVEADGTTKTGLTGYLKERGLRNIFVCGLATDFCVSWSAQHAASEGFTVSVIEDACKGIDLDGSMAGAWQAMKEAGVERITSNDIS
ncbi:nicotinamidase [Cobetia sp. L2A1]|uniref:nicotinamidase n=1 Tax=Cobetia sp. L2A1 TaxID=2686360 RepID=UPI0018EECD28|nr:isochorismatase family protein [Cobetia sp. L2A1]